MNLLILKKKKGYSLLETVVYTALFAMISVAILSTIDLSSRIYRSTRVNTIMNESGDTALERVSRSIREANDISLNSSFGSNPGILELIGPGGSITKFDVSGGVLRLTENGSVSGNLTGQSLVVQSLIFRKITTGHGYAIKTELELSHPQSGKVEDFQTTIILRNAY